MAIDVLGSLIRPSKTSTSRLEFVTARIPPHWTKDQLLFSNSYSQPATDNAVDKVIRDLITKNL